MTTLNLDRIIEIARRYSDQVYTLPFLANVRGVRFSRANRKNADGSLHVAMPDEWVRALTGDESLRPLMFGVYIPRQVVDIADSGLILPGLDTPRNSKLERKQP